MRIVEHNTGKFEKNNAKIDFIVLKKAPREKEVRKPGRLSDLRSDELLDA